MRERSARADVGSDGLHVARNLGAVTLHPDVVPAEHRRCGEQHGGVEDLLAHPFERAGDGVREEATMTAPEQAEHDAAAHVAGAAGDAPRRGEDDADDQGGLDDLPQDDDGRGDHGCTTSQPRAVWALNSPKNS